MQFQLTRRVQTALEMDTPRTNSNLTGAMIAIYKWITSWICNATQLTCQFKRKHSKKTWRNLENMKPWEIQRILWPFRKECHKESFKNVILDRKTSSGYWNCVVTGGPDSWPFLKHDYWQIILNYGNCHGRFSGSFLQACDTTTDVKHQMPMLTPPSTLLHLKLFFSPW